MNVLDSCVLMLNVLMSIISVNYLFLFHLHDLFLNIILVGGDYRGCIYGGQWLPISNGTRHAEDISTMALHFLSAIKRFKIRHLPNEKLALRIGINSGMQVITISVLSDVCDVCALHLTHSVSSEHTHTHTHTVNTHPEQ